MGVSTQSKLQELKEEYERIKKEWEEMNTKVEEETKITNELIVEKSRSHDLLYSECSQKCKEENPICHTIRRRRRTQGNSSLSTKSSGNNSSAIQNTKGGFLNSF